ncbi:MAG: RagB/SusD family nutrient uptake outer membrane protein [Bacteroidales bacterium]|nr:RagB/SusD family nutrient uptake outer membrane protein [Bacteroidales bacterium]
MKENILKLALVFCAIAFMSASCSKILDIAPNGMVSLDEIFADNDQTAAYLNTCYENIPEKGTSYDQCNAVVALTDDAYLTYALNGLVSKMYSGSATAASHPLRDSGNYYQIYFSQIRYCTIFLQRIGGANVASEDDRARWTAEAHVLRAYFMLELIKWFGGYAYNPDGYSIDFDYTQAVKKSVYELAEYIEQDCDAAIATPQLPWKITESSDGIRVNKALAYTIKATAYLFAASPLHNTKEKDSYWDKAYEVCKDAVDALESNGYELYRTITDNSLYSGPAGAYYELMSSTLPVSLDKETIWKGKSQMYLTALHYVGSLGGCKGGLCPTQQLVDAYEVTNADRTKAEPLLNLSRPYSANVPNFNPAALELGYDDSDPYKCYRDPRMAVTVIKNGDTVIFQGEDYLVETFEGGKNGIDLTPNLDMPTRTGYYFRKFIKPGSDLTNHEHSPAWKYFRLAELKLDLAEAAIMTGNLDVARKQINDVRSRVGMPDIPTSLSQGEMLLRLKNERRIELVYEETRYFDIRRWSGSEDDLSAFGKTLMSMWITKNEDGTFNYERKAVLMNNSTKNRDLLMPYPYTEATNLRSLTGKNWQNPNW